MQITPEAKRLLLARLGADRALSRAEIDKLALYAHGKSMIEESDVEAAVGDAAELALDRIVMAAASGRTAAALAECDRSVASGESAQAVIAALQRHFLRLHRMRGALDAGRSMEDVVRSLRPPPHFKQREAHRAAVPRAGACRRLNAPGASATRNAARLNARWRARWRSICCWSLARWQGARLRSCDLAERWHQRANRRLGHAGARPNATR